MATVRQSLAPADARFKTSAFPAYKILQGSNFPVEVLAYDAGGTEDAYWRWDAISYGSGNITLQVRWYADSASSGVVRWECAVAAITPDTDSQDVETKAFATAQASDDTHLGTTGQRLHAHDITISNLDGIAANDSVWLRVSRLGGHANDTMAGDALLEGLQLSYSDT